MEVSSDSQEIRGPIDLNLDSSDPSLDSSDCKLDSCGPPGFVSAVSMCLQGTDGSEGSD